MLSAEQFAELVSLIETMRDGGPKSEVRRVQRVPHMARVGITLGTEIDAGPTILVTLKDISARGMCILHNLEMPRGLNFVVHLERETGESVNILCTACHSKLIAKDLYSIGVAFTSVLGEQPETQVIRSPEDLIRIRRPVAS